MFDVTIKVQFTYNRHTCEYTANVREYRRFIVNGEEAWSMSQEEETDQDWNHVRDWARVQAIALAQDIDNLLDVEVEEDWGDGDDELDELRLSALNSMARIQLEDDE